VIHSVTKGLTTDVGVLLLDASDNPKNGVLYSDVTVMYRKNGQTSFTVKSLLAGEWTEVGDGLYRLTFTSTELDAAGSFRYLLTGATFSRHENDVLVVDEYQSLAAQIVDIKQQLTTKANIRDVDILFSQLELRMRRQEQALTDLRRRLKSAEAALGALRGT
jgi:hypothetical protein